MSEVVLDASALLAFLQGEPGRDAVAAIMSRSCMSAVNAAEVISKLVERGVPDGPASDAVMMLPLEIVPFDAENARDAGLLHRSTRGRNVSLGDRACLSLAARRRQPAMTTDGAWGELGLGVEIRAIR